MDWNIDRVRENVRQSETEDLLDRITLFRSEMEPAAIALIETELDQRGIRLGDIQAHHDARREAGVIERTDGTARRCHFCFRASIACGWGWHKLGGLIPLFPRFFYCCENHRDRLRSENPS